MPSSPYVLLSDVPQESVLATLLVNICINDLCDVMNHSICLSFADGRKVPRDINSPGDCLLLRSDTDNVHERCSKNFMET
jgi:hypothetical protein